MISELLLWSISIGLFLYGLDYSLDQNEIFGFVRKAVDRRLRNLYSEGQITIWKFEIKAWKPVIMCPVCMSSLWGGTIAFMAGFTWEILMIIPMTAGVVLTLINMEKDK